MLKKLRRSKQAPFCDGNTNGDGLSPRSASDPRTRLPSLAGRLHWHASRADKSEAERRKLEFLRDLEINSSSYQIPSAQTFGDAARHYREKFGPTMHRGSGLPVRFGKAE